MKDRFPLRYLRKLARALTGADGETRELEIKVQERTRELSEANKFLDSIIENIPNMIFVKDAHDLRFVRFNKAGEDLIGVSRSQLIGKDDFDFFPESEAKEFTAGDRAVIDGGEVVDIPEEPISTQHQGTRTLHTKKLPVYDENGKPRYLIGISEDITEFKRLENERLQLIEERIAKTENERVTERFKFLSRASALLGSSLEFEKTLKNLTELAVPSFADFCSVQLYEANGVLKQIAFAHRDPEKKQWARDFHSKFPANPNATRGAAGVARTGKAEMLNAIPADVLENVATSAEHLELLNKLELYSYICAPIRARENVIGVLTLVSSRESMRHYSDQDLQLAEDLGERAGFAVENARLYKEARMLNRVKDEFLATLSHELRTPLNVIQGHAEILKTEGQTLSPEELALSADAIFRNAKTQLTIVSDLLDVSSIITGKISFKPVETPIGEIVRTIVDGLTPTAASKGVKLSLDTSHAPRQVYGDPTRLQQIIFNLISNALKFTPIGGHVDVIVSKEDEFWSIIVRDTGLGIERDFLPYVFERFRQEDSSTSRAHGGLGLGLSIVRSLSELHGGTVSAVSKGRGQGACFTVTLPISGVQKPNAFIQALQSPSAKADVKGQAFNFSGVKVLVVEDSADNRALMRRMLEKVGVEFFEADSAQAAREILKSITPDVIISDIGMPQENGLEFMRSFRNHVLPSEVPSIALTAYVREEEREASLSAGFQAHLGKPVSNAALLSTLESVLKR